MLKRIFNTSLQKKMKSFPIVSILGPRQCGKTTFVKSVLPDWKYLDLEKPSDAIPVMDDPEGRLKQLGSKIIFDEAQQVPKLFEILRSYVDENRSHNGQFVLLGSASPGLIKGISESLAGRTAFLEMSPFLWPEIADKKLEFTINRLWLRGGFPDAFLMKDPASLLDWYEGYTRTFIERDLTAMGITISPTQMRKLWMMLAHANGTIWNASQIASSLGLNYQTINRYTDILEQTFLIRKLQPYYINIKKRMVKSPKILLRDTGLLHYFLGIQNKEGLDVQPSRGASWESFIVEQLISLYTLYVPGSRFWYWRTQAGAEVDLLIEKTGTIIPIEIKLHSSPSKDMTRGLVSCMNDLKIQKGYIVYPGNNEYSLGKGITVLPLEKVLNNPEVLSDL